MNVTRLAYDYKDLLDLLQFCAHKLLLAYDENLQNELWVASEKAAEACQSLMPLIHGKQQPTTTFH